jgi:hypothetical protein
MPASTAARWASWVAAGRPSPPAGGPASNLGVSFLPGLFGPNPRILVEAAFGADLAADETTWNWIDLTSVVYFSTKITIVQGRTDNTSTAQPGTCSLTFTNDAGNLTPYHPASVYYPNVRRGTPLRVRVDLDLGTGPVVIYQGSIASMTPTWDVTGKLPLVAVTAGGTTRRLTQGKTPLRSALYRASSKLSGLFAYWPMEDGESATSFASAVGGKPLVQTGATAATFANDAPAGSLPLPNFTAATAANGVPYTAQLSYPTPTAGYGICISFVMKLTLTDAAGTYPAPLIQFWIAGNPWQIQYLNNSPAPLPNLFLTTVNNVFTTGVGVFNDLAPHVDGQYHLYQVVIVPIGSDIWVSLYDDGAPDPQNPGHFGNNDDFIVFPLASRVTSLSVGAPSQNDPNHLWGYNLGHVALSTASAADLITAPRAPQQFASAVSGFIGESAIARLERLCGEEVIDLSVIGTSNITMGPQPVADIMSALREPETADIGVLYDGFGSGIGYRARSSWYNLAAALTIDASTGQVGIPFAPVDDDQRLRNDATVSRSGGSSAEVTDTDGENGTAGPGRPGVYDTSLTVNVDSDDLVDDIAGWIVRLGTVEGLRYPTLAFDFAATPALAQLWLNVGTPGFRVDVTNMGSVVAQHPPGDISLIVEGWTMHLDTTRWTVTANCSRFDPFVVPVLNDPVLGKLGTNSTSQHDGWDGVVGSFTIDTATGPLWSTDPAQYPVDLNCGGQRVTVSGCSGAGNPQTLTVSVASVNGISKSHPPGEAVKLWYRLRPAL